MRDKILKKFINQYDIYEIEKLEKSRHYTLPDLGVYYDGTKKHINSDVIDKDVQKSLDYIYELIKVGFKVRMPDRNIKIRRLFNYIPHLENLENPLLIRFDIKNFFMSISIKKFYKELEKNTILRNEEKLYLKSSLENQNILYPGVKISNIISEVMGNILDKEMGKKFPQMIYYSRYVDDIIIVMNDIIEEEKFLNEVRKLVRKIFGESSDIHDKDSEKYAFLTNKKDRKTSIDYLGYKFNFDENLKIESYGIADEKIEKSEEKLRKILNDFKSNKNFWMFKLRIDAFYKRTVALRIDNEGNNRWGSYGISQNYKELKRIPKKELENKLDEKTFELIKGKIIFSINNENNIIPRNELGKIIRRQIRSDRYIKLFYDNKALIFNTHIGLNKKQLKKIAKLINVETKYKCYADLSYDVMRKLLIIK